MSCPRAAEIMFVAMDREATPQEDIELHQHMAGCASCAAEWRALQAVDRLLVGVEAIEPPPTLAPRAMYSVARYRQRQAGWRLARTCLYVFVGGLALAATPALAISTLMRDNPTLANALATLWQHLTAMALGVAGALETFLRVKLGGQFGLMALCWVFLTVLLTLAWLRLMALARSQGVGA